MGAHADTREKLVQGRAEARERKLRSIAKQAKTLRVELERRRRDQSICYYTPHPPQATAHGDTNRIRLVLGGNRSGKSHWEIAEAVAHSIGYRPWLPESHPHRDIDVVVPNKGLLCGESFGEQVKKVLLAKLLGDPEHNQPGLIPRHLIKATKKNQQGVITFIQMTNGSTITLQSYDQDADLFEGTDFDWVGMDEPPPRPIYIAVSRGLVDRRGKLWMAMTPLKEPWIYDELVARKDISVYNFDIEDNVGFGLTREAVDEFARNLDKNEQQVRLRGKFFQLQGLVYDGYMQHANVLRVPRRKVERTWGIWQAIDPHPREPHHAIWLGARPDERLFVIGELKNADPNNLVKPFCERMAIYEQEVLGIEPHRVERLIDPSATSNNPIDGRTVWDEFCDHGFVCRMGSKHRDAGISLLSKMIHYDNVEKVFPSLFFFDDLEGLHYEMTHYIWDEWGKGTDSYQRTQKQVPRDKDDHFIECLHRILLDEPRADDEMSNWQSQPDVVSRKGEASYGY